MRVSASVWWAACVLWKWRENELRCYDISTPSSSLCGSESCSSGAWKCTFHTKFPLTYKHLDFHQIPCCVRVPRLERLVFPVRTTSSGFISSELQERTHWALSGPSLGQNPRWKNVIDPWTTQDDVMFHIWTIITQRFTQTKYNLVNHISINYYTLNLLEFKEANLKNPFKIRKSTLKKQLN